MRWLGRRLLIPETGRHGVRQVRVQADKSKSMRARGVQRGVKRCVKRGGERKEWVMGGLEGACAWEGAAGDA